MSFLRFSYAAGWVGVALALFVAAPTGAQTQAQINWCVNKGDTASPDLVIQSCTAAIQSGKYKGKEAAWAFYGRANAYRNKSDYNNAIADYSEAIRLDPQYAYAYGNRGLAYSDREEIDRAIAD